MKKLKKFLILQMTFIYNVYIMFSKYGGTSNPFDSKLDKYVLLGIFVLILLIFVRVMLEFHGPQKPFACDAFIEETFYNQDINKLKMGVTINVSETMSYVARMGDTWEKIVDQYGIQNIYSNNCY